MSEHSHPHPPETQDAGSQALSEALRSSFVIVQIAMAVLVVVILASGIFTVGPQEKAVILRFGKPVGQGQKMLIGPGLHWAWPQPIDEIVRIPITEIQKVTSTAGWYLTTPEAEVTGADQQTFGASLNPVLDGYVITADRNIVHTRVTVSYHIDDPQTAIFNFTSGTNHEFNLNGVSNAVLNAANNAIVSTAARFNVDDILTGNVEGFRDAVRSRVNQQVEEQHLGIAIDQCLVQSVAPRQLKAVFAQVTTERQNRGTKIAEAQGAANTILSQAYAQAASITNLAETARTNFVTSVQSDAEVFKNLLPRYLGNPRLYMQTELAKVVPQILTKAQRTEFLSKRADGKSRELRLLLNDLPLEDHRGQ